MLLHSLYTSINHEFGDGKSSSITTMLFMENVAWCLRSLIGMRSSVYFVELN